MSAIVLTGVTKVFETGPFQRKTAVDALSLSIPRGEVIGLLGANGSGKSTTLKMILGFLRPTRGQIQIEGRDAGTRESRRHLGYLPENPKFQKFLRGAEVLTYIGRLHGMRGKALEVRCGQLLELVGLTHAGRERVAGYSKGMTQRLAIAQSMLNHPALLIFDEPMSGLDPLGRMEIRSLISRIHQEMPQATLFFSTHILADAEALCTSVALLKHGKLQVHCPIAQLLQSQSDAYELTLAGLPKTLEAEISQSHTTSPSPLGLTVTVDSTLALEQGLAKWRAAGARVLSIYTKRPNLEQALFGDATAKEPQ